MTISELNDLLDKQPGPSPEYDLLKDAPEIIRGNFPKMRSMKRRLAMECAAMVLAAIVCFGMYWLWPPISIWVTAVAMTFIALFLLLDYYAFRAYWYTPTGPDFAAANRKFSRRLNRYVKPMEMMNASMVMFTLVVIFIDAHVTRIVTWEMLGVLFAVQFGTFLFSRRWVAYARHAEKLTTEFANPDTKHPAP